MTHQSPRLSVRQRVVCSGCIGLCMATNNELTDHARQAQQEDAGDIDQDECSTTVLTSHIGETPHIAQTDGGTRRGQHHTQLAAEATPFLHNYN